MKAKKEKEVLKVKKEKEMFKAKMEVMLKVEIKGV